jgi:hypothetical protein
MCPSNCLDFTDKNQSKISGAMNQVSLSVNLSKRDKGVISTPLDDSLLVEFNPNQYKEKKNMIESKFNNQEIKINRAHRTIKQTV